MQEPAAYQTLQTQLHATPYVACDRRGRLDWLQPAGRALLNLDQRVVGLGNFARTDRVIPGVYKTYCAYYSLSIG